MLTPLLTNQHEARPALQAGEAVVRQGNLSRPGAHQRTVASAMGVAQRSSGEASRYRVAHAGNAK